MIDKKQLLETTIKVLSEHKGGNVLARLTVTMDVALTTVAKFETFVRELRGAKIQACNFEVGVTNLVEIVEPDIEPIPEIVIQPEEETEAKELRDVVQ